MSRYNCEKTQWHSGYYRGLIERTPTWRKATATATAAHDRRRREGLQRTWKPGPWRRPFWKWGGAFVARCRPVRHRLVKSHWSLYTCDARYIGIYLRSTFVLRVNNTYRYMDIYLYTYIHTYIHNTYIYLFTLNTRFKSSLKSQRNLYTFVRARNCDTNGIYIHAHYIYIMYPHRLWLTLNIHIAITHMPI